MPARFQQMVEQFTAAHPRATRGEWLAMAVKLAEVAYKAGYVRGWEASVRDPEQMPTTEKVNAAAEWEGQDFSWLDSAPTTAELALDAVPLDEPEDPRGIIFDEVKHANEMEQKYYDSRSARGPRRI